MKNRLLLFLLSLSTLSFSQDTPYHYDLFSVDSCGMYNNPVYCAQPLTNSSSIWQISPPLKSTIDTVRTYSLLLITDSINPYPINDTSSFYIRQIDSSNLAIAEGTTFSGYYWCNTDSLKDYGTIELFLPSGHWINLNDDTIYCDYYPDSVAAAEYIVWSTPKPVLTGNSNGWVYFSVKLSNFGLINELDYYDSLIYRIKFQSDSIFDSLDGLAFDNFILCNNPRIGGLSEHGYLSTKIFPNPSNNSITLLFEQEITSNLNFIIENSVSQSVSMGEIIPNNPTIDISKLSPGWYTLNCFDEKNQLVSRSKFVVQ